MAKILHTADLHLQQPADERWQALETILQTATKHKVDAVTIAGDLFEQNVHSHQLRDKLRALFSKLNYQLIILPGNHDINSFEPGLFFGDNVTLLTDSAQQLKVKDVIITGLPFEPLSASELFHKLEEINAGLDPKAVNILLFHGELTDLFFNSADFGDEGKQRYLPLKLNLLTQTKFDYILAGHFHSKFHIKRLPNQRLKQGGYFVYPGSPVSITTKELGVRQLTLIETSRAPQPIEISSFHYQPLELFLTPQDDQKVLAQLEAKLKKQPEQVVSLLKITGFFDQKKLKLNETQLKQKIMQLAEQSHARLDAENFEVKDISQILNSGLYQVFVKKLQAANFEPDRQQQLLQRFTQALMQTNS